MSNTLNLLKNQNILRKLFDRLARYAKRVTGSTSLLDLILYEFLSIIGMLPGIAGIASRGFFWPLFYKKIAGSCVILRNVVIRGSRRITIGHESILDRDVLIDIIGEHGYVTLGSNCEIRSNAILNTGSSPDGFIEIGDYSSVNSFTVIMGHGGITIGKNVLIGPHVGIYAVDHAFTNTGIPIRLQGYDLKGIRIDDDVWIGGGATILDGVTIQKGAVVAAGSVVTRDVRAFSVVAGSPVKVIGNRG